MEDEAISERKNAVIVMGMHRSGTSAMTRVLSLAGAKLPMNLMASGPDNPHGHWEPQDVMELNDRILQDLDSSWDDIFGPRRTENNRLPTSKYLPRAREIIRLNWPGADFIVFKDPRITILFDLWGEALKQEGFRISNIIMVRHPLEVAASLKFRDSFTTNASIVLWSTYMMAAEQATRNDRRVFVTFPDLLEYPESVLDRIVSELAIDLPKRTWACADDIETFLRSEDRHHVVTSDAGLADFKPVARFYRYLEEAARGAVWNEDVSRQLADWLASFQRTAGPIVRQLHRNLQSSVLAAREASEQSNTDACLRAEAEHRLAETEAALIALHALRDAELIEVAQRAAAADAALSAARGEAAAAAVELAEIKAARGAAQARSEEDIERARGQVASLEDALAAARARADRREEEVKGQFERLEAGARGGDERAEELTSKVKDLQGTLEAQEAALTGHLQQADQAKAEAIQRLADFTAAMESSAEEAHLSESRLQQRLATAMSDAETARGEMTGLKHSLSLAEASFGEREARLRIELLEAQADAREARLEQMESKIGLMSAQAQFTATINDLIQKLDRALDEASSARAHADAVGLETLTQLESRESVWSEQLSQATAEANSAHQRSSEMENQLATAQQEHLLHETELNERLQAASHEMIALRRQAAENEAALTAQNAILATRNGQLADQHEDGLAKLETLRAQSAELARVLTDEISRRPPPNLFSRAVSHMQAMKRLWR